MRLPHFIKLEKLAQIYLEIKLQTDRFILTFSLFEVIKIYIYIASAILYIFLIDINRLAVSRTAFPKVGSSGDDFGSFVSKMDKIFRRVAPSKMKNRPLNGQYNN